MRTCARAAAALAVFFLLGCGGGDGDRGGGGGGPEVDAGPEVVDLDTYLDENGIHRLEEQPDGTEYGEALTDETGAARFYSARHEAVFDMGVLERDVEMPLGGRRVQLAVGDEQLAYMISDPMGQYDPLLHVMEVPAGEGSIDVDAVEQMVAEEGVVEIDPETDPDPFEMASMPIVAGNAQPLTIIGVAFTFGIRSFLKSVAIGAVIGVFKNLVEGACNFVAPLYRERCMLIGNIVGAAASLYAGVFISRASAWELGATLLDGVLSAADVTCEKAGAALVGYVTDPGDRSARDRYREIARKFNYLLHRMETDPQPGQPTWAEAEEMAMSLIAVRDVMRDRYFQLWNGTAFDSAKPNGLGMSIAANAVGEFFNNRKVEVQVAVLTRLTISETVQAYLRIGPYDARYVVTGHRYVTSEWDTFRFEGEPADYQKAMNGLLANCAVTFVQGAVGQWADGAMMRNWELETREITNGMLDVLEATIDEIYAQTWGDTIPMGMCLADDYEPNATWTQAFASPVPTELGPSSVAEIMGLTMCDGLGGSGTEEDWYGWYTAPIEFMVQARLIGVDGGRGQDEPLCLDVYWYSEIYELAGTPPDRITGVCGRVQDWPATSPFGIRRALGESWSMVLLHVYPDAAATGADVEYGLRFTP